MVSVDAIKSCKSGKETTVIENARGAAPFEQPGRQTQSGVACERKCSEWDEGWSAGNAERIESLKTTTN